MGTEIERGRKPERQREKAREAEGESERETAKKNRDRQSIDKEGSKDVAEHKGVNRGGTYMLMICMRA